LIFWVIFIFIFSSSKSSWNLELHCSHFEEITICASHKLLKKELCMRLFLKLVFYCNFLVHVPQFEMLWIFLDMWPTLSQKSRKKISNKKVKLTCAKASPNLSCPKFRCPPKHFFSTSNAIISQSMRSKPHNFLLQHNKIVYY